MVFIRKIFEENIITLNLNHGASNSAKISIGVIRHNPTPVAFSHSDLMSHGNRGGTAQFFASWGA